MYTLNYDTISDELVHYTGSDVIQRYGGIPEDSAIHYISKSFLDGLVNYINVTRAFMINRYGLTGADDNKLWAEDDDVTRYRKATDELLKSPHAKFLIHDDTLVFGETENSFYFLWYDGDVSDCCIERVSKVTFPLLTLDIYIESVLTHMRETFDHWKHDFDQTEPLFTEFQPKGWLAG